MADDLRLVASTITASLISSGAVSIKDSGSEAVVKNAVSIFSMVLTEVMARDRQGKLYKQQ